MAGSTVAEEVLVVEECIAEAAVVAAFAARAGTAAAHSVAGAALSAALVQVDIATDLDDLAEAQRADSAEPGVGVPRVGPVPRLVGAEDREWEHRTGH